MSESEIYSKLVDCVVFLIALHMFLNFVVRTMRIFNDSEE